MFLVCNPEADDLHLKVLDTAHKDCVVGQLSISVANVIKQQNMEMPSQVKAYHELCACLLIC